MNCEPGSGKRKEGRPEKTWRTTFKEDLQAMGEEQRELPVTTAGGRNSLPRRHEEQSVKV